MEQEQEHLDLGLELDPLAPQKSMEALMALVHGSSKLKGKDKAAADGLKDHPIRRSHLDTNSSGLEMNDVQLILHIGKPLYIQLITHSFRHF
jgi:hypothetical protein